MIAAELRKSFYNLNIKLIHLEKNKTLVRRYKKRILTYVQENSSKPKSLRKYHHPTNYKFRQEYPSKWLGTGIMRTKGF